MKTSQLSSMPVLPPSKNDRAAAIGFYFFMASLTIGLLMLLLGPLFMF